MHLILVIIAISVVVVVSAIPVFYRVDLGQEVFLDREVLHGCNEYSSHAQHKRKQGSETLEKVVQGCFPGNFRVPQLPLVELDAEVAVFGGFQIVVAPVLTRETLGVTQRGLVNSKLCVIVDDSI